MRAGPEGGDVNQMGDLTFTEAMELVARFFEAVGAVVLLAGIVLAAGLSIRSARSFIRSKPIQTRVD